MGGLDDQRTPQESDEKTGESHQRCAAQSMDKKERVDDAQGPRCDEGGIVLKAQYLAEAVAFLAFENTAPVLDKKAKKLAEIVLGRQWLTDGGKRKNLPGFVKDVLELTLAKSTERVWSVSLLLPFLNGLANQTLPAASGDEHENEVVQRLEMCQAIVGSVEKMTLIDVWRSHRPVPPLKEIAREMETYRSFLFKLGCEDAARCVEERTSLLTELVRKEELSTGVLNTKLGVTARAKTAEMAVIFNALHHVEQCVYEFCRDSNTDMSYRFGKFLRDKEEKQAVGLPEMLDFITGDKNLLNSAVQEKISELRSSMKAVSTTIAQHQPGLKLREPLFNLLQSCEKLMNGLQWKSVCNERKREEILKLLDKFQVKEESSSCTLEQSPSMVVIHTQLNPVLPRKLHHWIRPNREEFVGRKEKLSEICGLLEKQAGKVLITGPSGIGKSTLAREAAYQLRTAWPTQFVLDMSTRFSKTANIPDIMMHYGLVSEVRRFEEETTEIVNNFLHLRNGNRLLLVVENCNSNDSVKLLEIPEREDISLIIVTRQCGVDLRYSELPLELIDLMVYLTPFSSEESGQKVAELAARGTSMEVHSVKKLLLNRTNNFPVAIQVAKSLLLHNLKYDSLGGLHSFARNMPSQGDMISSDKLADLVFSSRNATAVLTVVQFAMNLLERQHAHRMLVYMAAILAQPAAPLLFFESGIAKDVQEKVLDLQSLGLVLLERDEKGQPSTLRMHASVSRVIQSIILNNPIEGCTSLFTKCIRKLCDCLNETEKMETSTQFNVACSATCFAQSDLFQQVYEKAANSSSRCLRKIASLHGTLFFALAKVVSRFAHHATHAMPLEYSFNFSVKSLELLSFVGDEYSFWIVFRCYMNAMLSYFGQRQAERMNYMMTLVLTGGANQDVILITDGDNCGYAAQHFSHIASQAGDDAWQTLYTSHCDFEHLRSKALRSWVIQSKALTLLRKSRRKEAINLLLLNLSDAAKAVEEDSASYGKTLNLLASCCLLEGDKFHARKYYRDAMQIFEGGERNQALVRDLLDCLTNLGSPALLDPSKPDVSRGYLQQALTLAEEVYGEDHEDVIKILCIMANTEYALGNFSKVQKLSERIPSHCAAFSHDQIEDFQAAENLCTPGPAVASKRGQERKRRTRQAATEESGTPALTSERGKERMRQAATEESGTPALASERGKKRMRRVPTEESGTSAPASERGEERMRLAAGEESGTPALASERGKKRLRQAATEESGTPTLASERGMKRMRQAATEESVTPALTSERGKKRMRRAATEESDTPALASEKGKKRMRQAATEESGTPALASERGKERMRHAATDESDTPALASERGKKRMRQAATEESNTQALASERGKKRMRHPATEESGTQALASERGKERMRQVATEESDTPALASERGKKRIRLAATEESGTPALASERGKKRLRHAATEESGTPAQASERGKKRMRHAAREDSGTPALASERGKKRMSQAANKESDTPAVLEKEKKKEDSAEAAIEYSHDHESKQCVREPNIGESYSEGNFPPGAEKGSKPAGFEKEEEKADIAEPVIEGSQEEENQHQYLESERKFPQEIEESNNAAVSEKEKKKEYPAEAGNEDSHDDESKQCGREPTIGGNHSEGSNYPPGTEKASKPAGSEKRAEKEDTGIAEDIAEPVVEDLCKEESTQLESDVSTADSLEDVSGPEEQTRRKAFSDDQTTDDEEEETKGQLRVVLEIQDCAEAVAFLSFKKTASELEKAAKKVAETILGQGWINDKKRRKEFPPFIKDSLKRISQNSSEPVFGVRTALYFLVWLAKGCVRWQLVNKNKEYQRAVKMCQSIVKNVERISLFDVWLNDFPAPSPENIKIELNEYKSILTTLGCEKAVRIFETTTSWLFDEVEKSKFSRGASKEKDVRVQASVVKMAIVFKAFHHVEEYVFEFCRDSNTIMSQLFATSLEDEKDDGQTNLHANLDFIQAQEEPLTTPQQISGLRSSLTDLCQYFVDELKPSPKAGNEAVLSFWKRFRRFKKSLRWDSCRHEQERLYIGKLLRRYVKGGVSEHVGPIDVLIPRQLRPVLPRKRHHWIAPNEETFAGRKKELDRICGLLEKQAGTVLITGSSGIGKSRFAREAAFRLRSAWPSQFVLDMSTPFSLLASLAEMANFYKSKDTFQIADNLRTYDFTVLAMFNDLIKTYGFRILVILENLDSAEALECLKQTYQEEVAIVIVSREFQTSTARREHLIDLTISLENFSLEEAEECFESLKGIPVETSEEMQELERFMLSLTNNFPLAVHVAGKLLLHFPFECSAFVEDFVGSLSQSGQEDVTPARWSLEIASSENTNAVYNLVMFALDLIEHEPDLEDFVFMLAVLARPTVPVIPSLFSIGVSAADFEDTLETLFELENFGILFAEKQEEGQYICFGMQPLVSQIVLSKMLTLSPGNCFKLLSKSVRAMCGHLSGNDGPEDLNPVVRGHVALSTAVLDQSGIFEKLCEEAAGNIRLRRKLFVIRGRLLYTLGQFFGSFIEHSSFVVSPESSCKFYARALAIASHLEEKMSFLDYSQEYLLVIWRSIPGEVLAKMMNQLLVLSITSGKGDGVMVEEERAGYMATQFALAAGRVKDFDWAELYFSFAEEVTNDINGYLTLIQEQIAFYMKESMLDKAEQKLYMYMNKMEKTYGKNAFWLGTCLRYLGQVCLQRGEERTG